MVREDPNRKHGEPRYTKPQRGEKVYDNGTVKLKRTTPRGGAIYQIWNIYIIIIIKMTNHLDL